MRPRGIIWIAGNLYQVKKTIDLVDGAGNTYLLDQSEIAVYAGCQMVDNILRRLFNVNGTIMYSTRLLQLEHNLTPVARKARKRV